MRFHPLVPVFAALAPAAAQTTDPGLVWREQLERRIAAHPFFSRVAFTCVDRAPFLFYVQRPAKDEALYERAVVNGFLPFLEELLAAWERDYATPAGLRRRDGAIAIAVLASRGSYADYAQASRLTNMHAVRAHYDPDLQLAVTYEDAFAPAEQDVRLQERQALLHEAVHALQHAYAPGGRMPEPLWWNEGLAEYRSHCTTVASSLREPRIADVHWRLLGEIRAKPDLRPLLAGLGDLLEAQNYGDVVDRARRRVRGGRLAQQFALAAFYAQAAAFVEFLHDGGGGEHRAAFLRFTKLALGGGPVTLATAWPPDGELDLSELQIRFHDYVDAELRRRGGAATPAAAPNDAAEPDAEARAAPAEPAAAFDPAELAWEADETEARIAAALTLCAAGEYALALATLEAAPGGELPPRLARERIARLGPLRDELLATALQRRRKIKVDVGGTIVEGQIASIQPGSIRLRGAKAEQEVPLTALKPGFLLREGRVQGRYEQEKWLDTWLWWLDAAPPARLRDALAREDAATVALREDLADPFDAAAGEPGALLARLQRLVLPEDPAAARAELDALHVPIRKWRKAPLLERRAEPLRDCIAALAERAFALDEPACLLLAGKVEKQGDRLRVQYGPGQKLAADFTHDDSWLQEMRESLPKLATAGTELRATGRWHEAVGSGLFRWGLQLDGAQTLELQFELTGLSRFDLVLCAGENTGWISCSPGGQIAIFDPNSNLADMLGAAQVVYAGKKYRLRVAHDGKRVVSSVDGKKFAELANVGTRTRGSPGLFVHSSNPIRILSLTVEGSIAADSAGELRARYVASVLRDLLP